MSKNFVFSEAGKNAEASEASKIPVDVKIDPEVNGKLEAEAIISGEKPTMRGGRKVLFCSVCGKDFVLQKPFAKHEARCKALLDTRTKTAVSTDTALRGEIEQLKLQLQATQDRHLRMYESFSKQQQDQLAKINKQAEKAPKNSEEEKELREKMLALTETFGKLAKVVGEQQATPASASKPQATAKIEPKQDAQKKKATDLFNQSITRTAKPPPKPVNLPSGSWF